MSKQEPKILTELTELKDNISKVKDIFKKDLVITAQNILNKVDFKKYEFTDEEKKVEHEIEDMMEFISYIMNEFYDYSGKELDKAND